MAKAEISAYTALIADDLANEPEPVVNALAALESAVNDIDQEQLNDEIVGTSQLADDAVTTAKVLDDTMTIAKLNSDSKTGVSSTAATRYGLVPTGVVMDWCTVTAPTGWLLCNGAAVSRTTYSGLFAVIGTTFGSGDGSTTFNVPDFRDRVAIGAGTTYTLAATGGATTSAHTHTGPSHTHTGPSHTHTPFTEGHIHTMGSITYLDGATGGTGDLGSYVGYDASGFLRVRNGSSAGTGNLKYTTTGFTGEHSGVNSTSASGTGATGASGTGASGSTSSSTLQPYIALYKIIKA